MRPLVTMVPAMELPCLDFQLFSLVADQFLGGNVAHGPPRNPNGERDAESFPRPRIASMDDQSLLSMAEADQQCRRY